MSINRVKKVSPSAPNGFSEAGNLELGGGQTRSWYSGYPAPKQHPPGLCWPHPWEGQGEASGEWAKEERSQQAARPWWGPWPRGQGLKMKVREGGDTLLGK